MSSSKSSTKFSSSGSTSESGDFLIFTMLNILSEAKLTSYSIPESQIMNLQGKDLAPIKNKTGKTGKILKLFNTHLAYINKERELSKQDWQNKKKIEKAMQKAYQMRKKTYQKFEEAILKAFS
jgi:hypothetical protein